MPGASAGCTQPSSRITRRVWRGSGSAPVHGLRASAAPERAAPVAAPGATSDPHRSSAANTCPPRKHFRQHRAHACAASGVLRRRALDELAADVEQPAVLDARRTCGLAGAARQAAVEVVARRCADGAALDELLDEIDAPRGPSSSLPVTWYVGQVARQKPQCTQLRSSACASRPRGVFCSSAEG